MAAIKKRSLVDQVYEMLRGDIITLRRPLGSKLNVNELQDELGVSCTPIREAVNRLQQEGLVVYENNVGAHILDLDQHDITEIEQLAMTLHCAAIRLAMAHGDRAAIVTGLEKYLEEYRRARNVQSEVMAVNRFVGTFYAHCGNRRLDANMISIQGQPPRVFGRAFVSPGRGVRRAQDVFQPFGLADEPQVAFQLLHTITMFVSEFKDTICRIKSLTLP